MSGSVESSRAPDDQVPDTVRQAIAVVASTPAVVRSLLAGMPAAGLGRRGSDVWGARQVLEHLIDVEQVAFRDRIRRIVTEDRPLIRKIDPPGRLEQAGYAARSLDELLSELAALRQDSVSWLGSIDPARYSREGEHNVAGTIRAGELIHYWAVHDLLHLRQMIDAVQAGLLGQIGNMVCFLEDG